MFQLNVMETFEQSRISRPLLLEFSTMPSLCSETYQCDVFLIALLLRITILRLSEILFLHLRGGGDTLNESNSIIQLEIQLEILTQVLICLFSVILKSKRLNAPYIQKSHNLFITGEAGVEKKVSYSPISTTRTGCSSSYLKN